MGRVSQYVSKPHFRSGDSQMCIARVCREEWNCLDIGSLCSPRPWRDVSFDRLALLALVFVFCALRGTWGYFPYSFVRMRGMLKGICPRAYSRSIPSCSMSEDTVASVARAAIVGDNCDGDAPSSSMRNVGSVEARMHIPAIGTLLVA